MKALTIPQQRKLYKIYKEARLNEAHMNITALNTGSYSRPKDSEIIGNAKADILNFASVFERSLILEVEADLKTIGQQEH